MKRPLQFKATFLRRLFLGCVAASTLLGCGRSEKPSGPSFGLSVAPLSLTAIDYACYDILVTGPDGPVVSFGDTSTSYIDGDGDAICSWQYGNGAFGDIAYVAPCDADDGDDDSPAQAMNTVTVWFDGLYVNPNGDQDPSEDQDVGGWQDPCPNGCSLDVLCRENADSEVAFNFTVMRDAMQGFFDIAVEFDDIFCSAKLDCRDEFLHDEGVRSATAIVAFACTAGENEETFLHISDLVLTCDDGNPATPLVTHVLPSAGLQPGQQPAVSPGVFAWASYQGDEQLTSNGAPLEKCYWNRAVGLDLDALATAGVTSCTLSGLGTASDTITPTAIGPGVSYPIIRWSVPVYSDDADPNTPAVLCDANPLNGDGSGVTTEYVTVDTNPSTLMPFTGTMACGVDALACPAGPLVDGAPLGVTLSQVAVDGGEAIQVTVGGATTLIPLVGELAGSSLAADAPCCLHECCGTP